MADHAAAIYVRVSTEEQKSRGYSLPEQVRACQQKARELASALSLRLGQPVHLVEQLFEDTAPGDILERPALSALREWVRRYRPTWVICLDPDRLARRLTLQCLVADELERRGTQLVFVQHDFDRTSPEGRAFFQMRGIMAELEKAKILERTSRGKRGKLARGGVPHNVQIYGWDYDRTTGSYSANPSEHRWVERIFRWVAEERLTPGEVADRLTALGVPPPSSRRRMQGVARRWYASTVRFLLQNRAYVGELILNRADWRGIQARRQLPLHLRRALPPEDGGGLLRPEPRPEGDWVRLPIPPLIAPPLFAAAQEALSRRRRGGRRQHLLSGLVVCGLCGASVHHETKRRTVYLVCRNRYGGTRTCPLPLRPAGPVEEAVRRAIGERVWDPDPNGSVAPEERAELARLLQQKQAARRSMLALLRDGTIAPEEARSHLTLLEQQIQALREHPTRCVPDRPQDPSLDASLVRRLVRQVELRGAELVIHLHKHADKKR
ncbi:MAG: recombinase family protein [Bacillota bacterium]